MTDISACIKRLKDAQEAQAASAASAVRSAQQVADAQRNLQRAYSDAANAAGGGADPKAALADLSPAQAKFATFLLSMRKGLSELTAEAAAGFLPGLEQGMRSAGAALAPFRGTISSLSSALGEVSAAAGKAPAALLFGNGFLANLAVQQALLGEEGDVCVQDRLNHASLIDAARLLAMRQGAVLINTARGTLVDEAALEAARTGAKVLVVTPEPLLNACSSAWAQGGMAAALTAAQPPAMPKPMTTTSAEADVVKLIPPKVRCGRPRSPR